MKNGGEEPSKERKRGVERNERRRTKMNKDINTREM